VELSDRTVRDALKAVIDPHFSVSIEDMGMLRGIEFPDEGAVLVKIVVPCIGCPAWSVIQSDIKQAVMALQGVKKVSVKTDWAGEWKKSDMSPLVFEKAVSHGYRI